MDQNTVILFTRNGLGQAPAELAHPLAKKFLTLLAEGNQLPNAILFYTEGVRLACEDSPVLPELHALEKAGVRLVLCQTCLNYFQLVDKVRAGVVGGMGDILAALGGAGKVISV